MRSILEKSLAHLLNEEYEQAESLFHQFVVARARQIHESNRLGEDEALVAEWKDEDNYFTEDDLSGLENAEGEDHVAGDEFAADDLEGSEDFAADETADLDSEAADLDSEAGVDGEDTVGSDVVADDRIDDIQASLDNLNARFDELMAEFDGEDSNPVDGDMEAADADKEAADADMEAADADETMAGEEGKDEEADEDFDDIAESILATLDKVSKTDETDGKEVGAGKGFTQNKTSAISGSKKANPADAKPVKINSKDNDSFERETPPGTKPAPVKGRNQRNKAMDGMDKVSKEGDKSAKINSDFAKSGK